MGVVLIEYRSHSVLRQINIDNCISRTIPMNQPMFFPAFHRFGLAGYHPLCTRFSCSNNSFMLQNKVNPRTANRPDNTIFADSSAPILHRIPSSMNMRNGTRTRGTGRCICKINTCCNHNIQHISNIEAAMKIPSLELLLTISDVLNISIEKLFENR